VALPIRPIIVRALHVLVVLTLALASCDDDDGRPKSHKPTTTETKKPTPGGGTTPGSARPPPVRGLADYHSHQFAHLGFGGRLHTHDTSVSMGFAPNEDWTDGPYYGDRGTFFADVTGDGRADGIVSNAGGPVVVRRSTGSGFSGNEEWTDGPYYGDRGTFFADVTGDGRADGIVSNSGGPVVVRRSTGSGFSGNEEWTAGPFFGNAGTFFADVTGDGRSDAVAVNAPGLLGLGASVARVTVRRSTGTGFEPNEDWTEVPFFGNRGTGFADVTGDGLADAIAVNAPGLFGLSPEQARVTIRRSTGSSFAPNEDWTEIPFYGSRGTFFADVTGDGRSDAIAVNAGSEFARVTVRRSTGSSFAPNEDWTEIPFYGDRETAFADVTGDARADAIAVSEKVTIRRGTRAPRSAGCRPPLPFGMSFRVEDLVRSSLLTEAQAQGHHCYPTASNLAGQQMDTDSLQRAWEYGLRLLVVHAVNSEYLCKFANIPSSSPSCSDQLAVPAQLRAARELEADIDEAAGGPGRGWYRIVLNPAEARRVIGEGKLAVVLGVEASNAFGCTLLPGGTIEGIADAIGQREPETRVTLSCTDLVEGFTTARALAQMEHYWSLGARHFFTVHNVDGLAGGTALGIPMLHARENPTRLKEGGVFSITSDADRVIREVRTPIESIACADSDFDGGRCNARGLSRTGFALVRLLGDYGAIVDIDHLSLKAKNELRSDKGLGAEYPLVSSHSGVNAINHGDKRNEGQLTPADIAGILKAGGAFAPILHPASTTEESETYPAGAEMAPYRCGGTSEAFVQTYRYIVDRLSKADADDGTEGFVGVGFGSDFNGLATWPAPRFGFPAVKVPGVVELLRSAYVGDSVNPPPGHCYGDATSSPEPSVQYPFTSPLSGIWFERSVLRWSGRFRPYDISYDGVAHVGMIPDFMEELRVLMGLPTASSGQLDALWNGAEAYIRMWERAEARRGLYTTEVARGIRDKCRSAREELLPRGGLQGILERWQDAIARMRVLGCHGAS
jgi:microsomal dipeptidase-like Zn-dependent dipeptidase